MLVVSDRPPNFVDHHRRLILRCMILLLLVFSVKRESRAQSEYSSPVDRSTVDSLSGNIQLVDGSDIRFRRLPGSAGLSQTRVNWVAQDKVGFIWFGTQYGLNRYDGYKSKVFKQEPGNARSLSCVYVRSLLVDHAGTLWIGCDRFLDRFEPATETFAHYRIDAGASDQQATPIERIDEDRAGVLWLATERGLYRFDPATAGTVRLLYAPQISTSIAENRINESTEDREGKFWVAGVGGLEELDRITGRVLRRVPLHAEIGRFHEDQLGVFWMTQRDPNCVLATWNPRTNAVKCHSLQYKMRGLSFKAQISEILEDRRGTLWFSSTAGLLKLDRVHNRIFRYHNDPFDSESLESDLIIYLNQDQEGNIWTCFQGTEPNFFSELPQAFDNFTYQRGSLLDPLVTSIYEDHNGILWIGTMGGLNGIDRHRGRNIAMPGIGNEILTILEDHQGVLFCGTFHGGLDRIDQKTGRLSPYSQLSTNQHTDPVMRLIYDHAGNLWAAHYGGVGRYDSKSETFIMYTPDRHNTVQYQDIKEDNQGFLWLGGQNGLHRFDPQSGQFKIYEHNPGDPKSLSDNRVNSIHPNRDGTLWVGTQNGLDRLDPVSGTFQNYYEKDGLPGGVVSCILEDGRGVLWMSTNNGLSSFDPQSHRFQSFSAADGISGRDLTGWGACYKSPSGEMFFGGFGGATAFYPGRIANTSTMPRTVLTDFRLSGISVPIGHGSPLNQSVTSTDSITLSHQQNNFSIEFSALSYLNSEANRYRYMMEGLDHRWITVGSDQRIAGYTTLPAGAYTFRVQGATSRGPWSEPGAILRIRVLPAWWNTWQSRTSYVIAVALLGALIFMRHKRQMRLEWLRNERLRQVQADLAHLNRVSMMGELAASLAHDIKQPMAAALVNAKTCMRWLDRAPSDIEMAQSAATRTVKDLTRASEIVGRIGRLFKKETVQQEIVDINELITEMADLMKGEAALHRVSIKLDLEPALPRITGDRVGLQQVFLNLMLNGIEAIRDTGSSGALCVKSRPHEENALVVEVSDTGPGVVVGKEKQIFDRFFTTKPRGTGMGLSISHSIVEAHGGRLWVTKNEPHGAVFHFTVANKIDADSDSPQGTARA